MARERRLIEIAGRRTWRRLSEIAEEAGLTEHVVSEKLERYIRQAKIERSLQEVDGIHSVYYRRVQ
jgi:predicted transcriptional regulator